MVALPRPGLDEIDLGLTQSLVRQRLFGDAPRPITVGRFQIRTTAGLGAMGRVYVARDPDLERDVAIKVISADAATPDRAERLRRRLRKEAKALARLSHPNVVSVFETGFVGSDVFVAMEYVRGQTLRAWLGEERDARSVISVFAAAGDGLAAAHQAGMVHRDFKPDNVIVGTDGRARVLDFGLVDAHGAPSESSTDDPHRTESTGTRRAGTPAYMAPEVRAGKPATFASDQYSLCLALFEALVGRRPEARELASTAALRRTLAQAPRGVAGHIQDTLLRGLSHDPEDRHPSMETLVERLRDDPVAARRRRWIVLGAAAAAASMAYALAVYARPSPCAGLEDALTGVWDASTRADLELRFDQQPGPYAAELFDRITPALDDYAARWLQMRRDVCEAAQVSGEQSLETTELRLVCLEKRRTELETTAKRLSTVDATVLQRAVPLVQGLSAVEECGDVEGLRAVDRPQPKDREAVAAIEAHIAAARVAARAGPLAFEHATDATIAAEGVGHRPTLARALRERGRAEIAMQRGEAEQTLRDAIWAAEASRLDELVADLWIRLAVWVGDLNEETTRAQDILDRASASVERLRRPKRLQTRLALARGQIAVEAGQHDDARRFFEQALELTDDPALRVRAREGLVEGLFATRKLDPAVVLMERNLADKEELWGPQHPNVAVTALNLGTVLVSAGKPAQALPHLDRAQQIFTQQTGSAFLRAAGTHNSMGAAYEALDKPEDALRHYQSAVGAFEKAGKPDHPELLPPLTNVGRSLRRLGRPDEAVATFERALSIGETAHGPEHLMLADPLTSLGSAKAAQSDYEGAARAHRRALDLRLAGLGSDALPTAISRHNLADALQRIGEAAQAVQLSEAAASRLAKLEPEHPYRIEAYTVLSRCRRGAGDNEGALSAAEEALRGATASGNPSRESAARFEVAQSLAALQRDPGRARAEAERALAALGDDHPELAESIRTWLG